MKIGNIVYTSSKRFPNKAAIIFEDKEVTYQALNHMINRVGNHLLKVLGVAKGQKVGILAKNSLAFVVLYYAIQKIGAVIVPINIRYVKREIKYALDFADCEYLIFSDEFFDEVNGLREELNKIGNYICIGKHVPSWASSYEEILRSGEENEPGVEVFPDDVSIISFSGGTTGNPKGVVLTHQNIFCTALTAASQPEHPIYTDVHLLVLPLFHSAGLNGLLNLYMLIGATIVLMEKWSATEAVRLMRDYKVTTLMLIPSLYYRELYEAPQFDQYQVADRIRYILTSGSSFPLLVKKELKKRFVNAKISYTYGLTESGPAALAWCPPDRIFEKNPSIGLPHALIEVKIEDAAGQRTAIREVGEIVFRGPTTAREYYRQPELSEAVFKDGWCHTGDLGFEDEDGFLYFVDRAKDMVKSGGENIYPKEIEEIIIEHPKVRDVAVIGVPDPKFGEGVKAFIVPMEGQSLTDEEIISYCKTQMASYKKPRYIEFIDALPRNVSGKVMKNELRKRNPLIQ